MRNQNILKLLQAGFTLIELIIVIVVIGILAAVAIPKYQDLTLQANEGVLRGVAAAAASATSVQYSLKKGGLAYTQVTNCNQLQSGSSLIEVPTGITASGSLATEGPGQQCVFTHTASTASYTATNVYGVP